MNGRVVHNEPVSRGNGDAVEGYVHPDFSAVGSELARQLRTQRVGGAAVCVYQAGELVVDVWGGDRNASGDPWEQDTMALSFSTTKGVTSTALHVLADRGLVDYDAPVATYWPEFGVAGKEEITIRHLLSHESGLHPLRTLVDHASSMLEWQHMVDALAAQTPRYRPGTANGYQGITFGWLVGEIVRRVSGKSIGEFVQVELAAPLGLDGLYIGVPEDQRRRVAQLTRLPAYLGSDRLAEWLMRTPATQHVADALLPDGVLDVLWSEDAVGAEIPGANGVFTARSLARLYAVLACGGSIDGVQIVSPETVRTLSQVQNRRRDLVVFAPMMWRLGYHSVATSAGFHPAAFGHWGYGGSGAWADPKRQLAVALVLNRVAGTPLGDMRMIRIGGAATRCADRRSTSRGQWSISR
ncbi:MAG: beta-lactamase family protein [Acidimicrobiia bacterium]|nr:beta-lactamase family protein [Acidimicrobiia bacterium]